MKFAGSIPICPNKPGDNLNNGHWQFPDKMGGNFYVGFIYVIRDNYLKRFYLGKKHFYSTARTAKGVETPWRDYTSSSKLLKEMFKERPKDEFDFICLEQYKTKGTLSYSETWTLCLVEAPTNNMWYNTRVEKVSWSVKEPISERHKTRLNDAVMFCEMRS